MGGGAAGPLPPTFGHMDNFWARVVFFLALLKCPKIANLPTNVLAATLQPPPQSKVLPYAYDCKSCRASSWPVSHCYLCVAQGFITVVVMSVRRGGGSPLDFYPCFHKEENAKNCLIGAGDLYSYQAMLPPPQESLCGRLWSWENIVRIVKEAVGDLGLTSGVARVLPEGGQSGARKF